MRMSEFDDEALPRRRRPGWTLAVAVLLVVALLASAVSVLLLLRGRGRSDEPPSGNTLAEAGPVPFTERVPADREAPLPDRSLGGFGDGPAVDLAAYRGRPLVVNFWATWCAPCVEEMPDFDAVAGELGDRVAFLGVDVADAPRFAEPFAQELGIDYDLAIDPDRSLAAEVGVASMPTTLFVDAEGTIVHRAYGALDAPGLRAALADHLGVRA